MYSVYKVVLVLGIMILCLIGFNSYQNFLSAKLPTKTIQVAGHALEVEVANTELTRAHGLSDRTTIAKDTGMLFVFPTAGFYEFWMKDMHFPIDMIWVGVDHKIVSINENVSPDTYPQLFSPKEPALYVIEVGAGYAENYRVSVGDEVTGL